MQRYEFHPSLFCRKVYAQCEQLFILAFSRQERQPKNVTLQVTMCRDIKKRSYKLTKNFIMTPMDTVVVYFFTRLNINKKGKKKEEKKEKHGWRARQTGKGNFVFQYSLIEQWCSELGLWNRIFLPGFKRIFSHRRFNEFSEEFSGLSEDFVIEDFVMLKLWIVLFPFAQVTATYVLFMNFFSLAN